MIQGVLHPLCARVGAPPFVRAYVMVERRSRAPPVGQAVVSVVAIGRRGGTVEEARWKEGADGADHAYKPVQRATLE